MSRWFYGLLVFAVLAVALAFLHIAVPPLLLFVIAGLGILPLAALIGQSVEQVAEHTGERIGGLLFATFGNATDLIQVQAALALNFFRILRRPKKSVGNHDDGSNGGSTHRQHEFPIRRYGIQ